MRNNRAVDISGKYSVQVKNIVNLHMFSTGECTARYWVKRLCFVLRECNTNKNSEGEVLEGWSF